MVPRRGGAAVLFVREGRRSRTTAAEHPAAPANGSRARTRAGAREQRRRAPSGRRVARWRRRPGPFRRASGPATLGAVDDTHAGEPVVTRLSRHTRRRSSRSRSRIGTMVSPVSVRSRSCHGQRHGLPQHVGRPWRWFFVRTSTRVEATTLGPRQEVERNRHNGVPDDSVRGGRVTSAGHGHEGVGRCRIRRRGRLG